MAELLIDMNTGYVITVQEDGWPWGRMERGDAAHGHWRVLEAPTVPVARLQRLLERNPIGNEANTPANVPVFRLRLDGEPPGQVDWQWVESHTEKFEHPLAEEGRAAWGTMVEELRRVT